MDHKYPNLPLNIYEALSHLPHSILERGCSSYRTYIGSFNMNYIISRNFEIFLQRNFFLAKDEKRIVYNVQHNLSFEMESSNLINYATDMCWSYSWTRVSLYWQHEKGPFWTPIESGGSPTKPQLKTMTSFTVSLCFIRLFQGSTRSLKAVCFFRFTVLSSSESTGFDCSTSDKISCAGSHSGH